MLQLFRKTGRFLLLLFSLLPGRGLFAQAPDGIVVGNVLDSSTRKALAGAQLVLRHYADSSRQLQAVADGNGFFQLMGIPYGLYRLEVTAVGFRARRIDSIHIRQQRADFNLGDLLLSNQAVELTEVVVYAEKPLVESKEGNITFNVGETALGQGSSVTDLLRQTPLVSTDPNGKILVRGKEPRILIDDKPVDLNLQQLQDLLESMSGSTIEKIEVLTNPPPQYASEQGGVINIVTRKGRIGWGGRASLYAGSRGEAGLSFNFNYRKKGLALNVSAGAAYNEFEGSGSSNRVNRFADSANRLFITNSFNNRNLRPNLRMNLDYDINSRNSINLVAQFNRNGFNNAAENRFTNFNRNEAIFRLSERAIETEGFNNSPSITATFLHKARRPGTQFRLIAGFNTSANSNQRHFFQQFFNPDQTPNGIDSTQKQITLTSNNGFSINAGYDRQLPNKKTSFSTGALFNRTNSNVDLQTSFLRKPDALFEKVDLLSNNFIFHQDVVNLRSSVKHVIKPGMSVSAGVALELTNIFFELLKINANEYNRYLNLLPFANFSRSWANKTNLSVAYRRTIRRPGINELNPAIDYTDPYNLRYGNPDLLPSLAHTFDVVVGKTKETFFINLGTGFNLVEDIFAQIRTLQGNGVTIVSWDNVSQRKEYELSSWSGLTLSKKLRLNWSASYVYNVYGSFDKEVRRFRDGGTFTSNLNSNFNPTALWTFTAACTFNRFANPQGTVRSNLNMNLGIQRKLLAKKLLITFNAIDPFAVQQNRTFTSGTNFTLESISQTQTRNFRLSVSYQFSQSKTAKLPAGILPAKVK